SLHHHKHQLRDFFNRHRRLRDMFHASLQLCNACQDSWRRIAITLIDLAAGVSPRTRCSPTPREPLRQFTIPRLVAPTASGPGKLGDPSKFPSYESARPYEMQAQKNEDSDVTLS